MEASKQVSEYSTFSLGDWTLQSGEIIPDAFIAFKTFGDPLSPAIIYPTWYSSKIADNTWLVGPGLALNPMKYFIVIPALFGNGESSSPSNNSSNLKSFPNCTFYDNVRAQYKLVTEELKIKHARAILGWSMGAAQTYQWITQYPDFADIAIPFCGSAKTSNHNKIALQGLRATLLAAKGQTSESAESKMWTEESKNAGLRAFGRVMAGWAFGQGFYRETLYASHLHFQDLETFLVEYWEAWALSKDPDNLLSMLSTWHSGDCSLQKPYDGDFRASMQGIKSRVLLLPGKTDLFFPPEDSIIELENLKPGVGKLEIIPSVWGHWAGGPGDSKEDMEWLNARVEDFLNRE